MRPMKNLVLYEHPAHPLVWVSCQIFP